MLELVEGLLQHVLRVDLLHTQQVQHHVVGQVEGAVQRVSRTLETDNNTGWKGNRKEERLVRCRAPEVLDTDFNSTLK